MDPRDFNIVASKLALGKTSIEAEYRSSISRAYYAAYHVCAEILDCLGIKVSTGLDAYSEVFSNLSTSHDKQLKFVGSQLGTLKSDRIKADYRLSEKGFATHEKAKAVVGQASRMIQLLDECKNAEPERKEKATASIKEYLASLEASKT